METEDTGVVSQGTDVVLCLCVDTCTPVILTDKADKAQTQWGCGSHAELPASGQWAQVKRKLVECASQFRLLASHEPARLAVKSLKSCDVSCSLTQSRLLAANIGYQNI